VARTVVGTEGMRVGTAVSLAAIWIACLAAAVLTGDAEIQSVALPAIPGALGAGLALRGVDQWRLLTAVALVPAAFLGPEILAWTVAGISGALLAGTATTRPAPLFADPQRHLVICRRRDEPATILVAEVPQLETSQLRALHDSTRVSDSLAVKRVRGGRQIYGVLEGGDVDRTAVERRLTGVLGRDAAFRWASFPTDGYTLDLLIEHAQPRAEWEGDAEIQGVFQEAARGHALANAGRTGA
jgi:hypothetical protein